MKTEITRSRIQVAENSLIYVVASFRDEVRSSITWGKLLLLYMRKSQQRWFGSLLVIPPQGLLEIFDIDVILRRTHNFLGVLYIISGLETPLDPQGEAGEFCWEEGCLVLVLYFLSTWPDNEWMHGHRNRTDTMFTHQHGSVWWEKLLSAAMKCGTRWLFLKRNHISRGGITWGNNNQRNFWPPVVSPLPPVLLWLRQSLSLAFSAINVIFHALLPACWWQAPGLFLFQLLRVSTAPSWNTYLNYHSSSSCTVLISNVQPANPLLIKTITCPSIHLLLNQPLSALAQCDSHLSSVLNSSYFHSFKEQGLSCVTLTSVPLPFSLCCLSSRGCSPYLFIPLSLIFFFLPFTILYPCFNAFCCLYTTHSGPVSCLTLLCLGFLFGCTLSAFLTQFTECRGDAFHLVAHCGMEH